MPAPPPTSRPLLRALTASGLVFGLTLVLVVLDAAADVRLPATVRPALPWILAGSAIIAITLLVGTLGTPSRPGAEPEDAPETDETVT